MGTSTSNPGQKGNTPLVPSWLDDVDGDGLLPSDPPAEPSPPQGQQPDQDSDSPQDPNQPGGRPETQEPDPDVFLHQEAISPGLSIVGDRGVAVETCDERYLRMLPIHLGVPIMQLFD